MNTKSDLQDDSKDLPAVEPLRKLDKSGRLYSRPEEVESAIANLSQLTKEQFVERIKIEDGAGKIPSECLLYFLRRPPFDADESVLYLLLTTIRQRVLRAAQIPIRLALEESETAVRLVDLNIRDTVLDKFHEMVCLDRQEYLERLDFYECRFNRGVVRLKSTARRDIFNDAARFTPLTDDNENSEPNTVVEKALSCIADTFDGPQTDFLYRSKIHAAINTLPPDELRVVELFLRGIPIDSQAGDTMTMVKILNCSEKTVRNRRDRAFAKLAELLKEESA